MARALAELTVLVILSLLPLLLLLSNHFFSIHLIFRIGVLLLSPAAMLGIWGLGQIPFKVELCADGLRTFALFKKEQVKWTEMCGLKQSNKYGFRQYLVYHASGEISFPYVISGVSELVETIRSRLPNRGRSITGDAQKYKLPTLVFFLEFVKLAFHGVFAGLFFWFYDSLKSSGKTSTEDLILILSAAVLFVLALFWRLAQLFRLVKEVELVSSGLKISMPFKTSQLGWNDIESVKTTNMLEPEGVVLKGKALNCLVSNSMDSFDELSEELKKRLEEKKKAGD